MQDFYNLAIGIVVIGMLLNIAIYYFDKYQSKINKRT